MRKVVVLCGNIGAGKSTVLRAAVKEGHASFPEPVDEWGPLLAQVYRNRGDPNLTMRLQSLIFSHYCRLSEKISAMLLKDDAKQKCVFVERCPAEALYVFLPLNRKAFSTDDYNALVHMHEKLVEMEVWQNASYVMLSPPIGVCLSRITKRARDGEECVAETYLKNLESFQKKSFMPRLPSNPTIVDSSLHTPREILRKILDKM